MWANSCAAYDALPDEMKTYLEDKVAVHMGDFRSTFAESDGNSDRLNAATKRFGSAFHKIVQVHPMTERKFLYVNEAFTMHVVGMNGRQSRRLLNYLFSHIDRPEYQVRFKWRAGSIATWDNRCTEHYAVADYMFALSDSWKF